ncbi:unnamed protein product [Miscanthus lutarioriparius]|uniref:sterol 3beta-glucosyltransferase n=1 Tax=Miscanthus lutarioriparius TaxID=422564 RepID=A0A811NCX8_9POAL|nr:unnamed protein product [Miscanthus lutarioriparius]
MKEASSSRVGGAGAGAEDIGSSSVSNNCFPQDEGISSSEMDNTECSETPSEVSGSERTRPEDSKKPSSVLDKISIKKKLKLFSRMTTLKDDGTVVVDIPTNIEAASLDLPSGDHHNVAFGGEPLDSSDLQHRPPMQIAMLIVGTRGDVQPFIAIGKRLQDYGHRVRLATHANFKDFVMTTGLEFYPLGGDPKILAGYMVKNKGFLPATPSEIPIQRKQIRDIIFSLLPACKDPDIDTGVSFSADAIIANPAAYGHVHVAEALNIPIHIIFTMPWTPTCEFPHPFSHVKQPAGYRLSYQIVDSFVWLGIRDMINDLRKRKLKLRPVTYLSGTHAYSKDIPHAYIWSPYLVPKPKDWGPKIDVVGFCFLDLASNYEPPEPLLRWLGSGDSPIYIGFGSLPIPEPDKLTRIIVQALEITGQRGIINKGWGGLGNLEESKEFVYVLDNVPHDWLFLQCKAVVHHGGAGTTAAGLKAGCPTTIIPFFGDQFFWGSMVHARGLGAPPIPVEQLQLHSLIDAIKFMIDPKVKERAVELAKAMESEDGVDGAVKSFLKHLPQKRDSETTPTAPQSTFMRPLLLPVKRCFGMAS